MRGFAVYAFHIRKFGRIIMNPDVHVVEQRNAQRRDRRVPQSRHPEQQKTKRVHSIARKPEDPLSHEWHRPVRLIEMIDTQGALEAEVTFYRVEQIYRRDQSDDGENPECGKISCQCVPV